MLFVNVRKGCYHYLMISFIIPTLNEEIAIEKILRNLTAYSGPKEIIISDGKSKDKTVEIARRFTDKVVVYEGTERQTIAMGRNAGADVAVGDYVVFLDADVIIVNPDEFFGKALGYFKRDPKLTALTAHFRVMPEAETLTDRLNYAFINGAQSFANNVLHYGMAIGEFQMYPREFFKKIGGYNPKIVVGEDYECFRRAAHYGRSHLASDLTVYHTGRRIHKTGWIKLWIQWMTNGFVVTFLKRSIIKEWKVVR